MIKAILLGLEAVRSSPTMRVLLGDDEMARTHRAAEASEIWRNGVQAGFAQRFADAAATGEIRGDVPPDTLAHWVTRICLSLIADQATSNTAVTKDYLARS